MGAAPAAVSRFCLNHASLVQSSSFQLSPMRLNAGSATCQSPDLEAMRAKEFTLIMDVPYCFSRAVKPFCKRGQEKWPNSDSLQAQSIASAIWKYRMSPASPFTRLADSSANRAGSPSSPLHLGCKSPV